MSALNFKEIPKAHEANGQQDTFELFAREFLSMKGFTVLSSPDRGADAGVDLIVEERHQGMIGSTKVRWLVSCKHNAHSGNSVSPRVESNIIDRLVTNNCDAFMGFYSTLPSSGLTTNLEGIKNNHKKNHYIYDSALIERELIKSPDGLNLIKRFFPQSYKIWQIENPEPAPIFNGVPSLKCQVCGKELLGEEKHGIILSWISLNEDYDEEKIKFINWVCKGDCDKALVSKMRSIHPKLIDRWEDIPDVAIPEQYLRWMLVIFNELHGESKYSDEAFKDIKTFMINIFPYISRHLTSVEKERMEDLNFLASILD